MNDYEAGLLVREAELLLAIEPLLRQARKDRSDPENEDVNHAYYDGLITAYETVIALIKGENDDDL